jgi:hypothetical protein
LTGPLFGAVVLSDPEQKWHAVTAFGQLVPRLWSEGREKARVVMRRFIWNLNDESGGIGWGMLEAMAEVMASHGQLAQEYHNVFLSYIQERPGADNFIEHMPLRRGALWGAARLAQARPELGQKACPDLLCRLDQERDPACLGLVCLALSLLPDCQTPTPRLQALISDERGFQLYWDRRLLETSVGDLARQALKAVPGTAFDLGQ